VLVWALPSIPILQLSAISCAYSIPQFIDVAIPAMNTATILPLTSPGESNTSMPDTVPHAKGIARLTVHISTAFNKKAKPGEQPRWGSTEFRVYYATALFAIPAMVWVPYTLSRGDLVYPRSRFKVLKCAESHPNFPFYASRLSPGWINGRMVVSCLVHLLMSIYIG
jgi:hypothetical protein